MVSVEPFAAGGRTYFTMEMHKIPEFLRSRDSSILVFDMNADPETRMARRLDDGSVAHRVEAGRFSGSHEVLIYYSMVDYLVRWELHRTHTGISIRNPAVPADFDGDGEVDEDDRVVLTECVDEMDGLPRDSMSLDADLSGDGRVHEIDW